MGQGDEGYSGKITCFSGKFVQHKMILRMSWIITEDGQGGHGNPLNSSTWFRNYPHSKKDVGPNAVV